MPMPVDAADSMKRFGFGISKWTYLLGFIVELPYFIMNTQVVIYSYSRRISSERTKGGQGATTSSFDFIEDTPLGPEGIISGSGTRGSGGTSMSTSREREKVASLVDLLQELSVPQRHPSSAARGWTGAPSPASPATATKEGLIREKACAIGNSDERKLRNGRKTSAAIRIGGLEKVDTNESPPLQSRLTLKPGPLGCSADVPSTEKNRVIFDGQGLVRQKKQRQGAIQLLPKLSRPSRAILHGESSRKVENYKRSIAANKETSGEMLDRTSTQESCGGAFEVSAAQYCPSILPVAAGVDAAAGEASVPRERSTRRRRLDSLDRGIADKARALQGKSQWLIQVDAKTSSMWQRQDSSSDSVQRSLAAVPQDRGVQALREDRIWSSGDQNRPGVVPIGLKRTTGKDVDDVRVTELYNEGAMEPGMDSPRVEQEGDGAVGAGDKPDQAKDDRGAPARELRRVRGLCRVRGAILALVEWNVLDADGGACQELGFMLSSTLKVGWPQQYISYLEGKLVFRSEDDVQESQGQGGASDTSEGAMADF